jgi:DNA processing protein
MRLFGGRKFTDKDKIDWLRLSRTETIGPITFHRLVQKYGSATAAIDALPTLTRTKNIRIASVDEATNELDKIQKAKGTLIAAYEDAYPLALAAIEDAPPVITVYGRTELLNKPGIGIVGSRNCSLNGRKFAFKIAQDLGQENYIVNSGLARGIDTAAHEGALAHGTIAVVAGGADIVYPKENQKLYDQICESGAVISECAYGTQPIAQHFPKRNRIITGLSLGVIVVEANPKSGSLISARTAAEQGRDVFAVPGFPADPRASGTNALIKDGAILTRGIDDVLEHLQSFAAARIETRKPAPETLAEDTEAFDYEGENIRETLLSHLSTSPTAVDEIIRACQLRSATVHGCLLEMELSGEVQRLPGNRVCLVWAA